MKIENYPISVLENFEEVLGEMRKISSQSPNSLRESFSSPNVLFTIKATNFDNFVFEILSVSFSNSSKIVYKYKMQPWAENVNSSSQGSIGAESIVDRFNFWKHIIERYENLAFIDPIIEEYENEIFDYIKIIEDDADVKPFSLEQQIQMLNYLDKVDQISKKDSNEYSEIIESYISEIQSEITQLPKNEVMRRLSRLLAYARKSKMSLFEKFIDVFQKEILKKTLWLGADKLQDLIGFLQNLPTEF